MTQPNQDLGADSVDQWAIVFGGTTGQHLDDPIQPTEHCGGTGPFSFGQHLMERPQIVSQGRPGFRLVGGIFQFGGDGLPQSLQNIHDRVQRRERLHGIGGWFGIGIGVWRARARQTQGVRHLQQLAIRALIVGRETGIQIADQMFGGLL